MHVIRKAASLPVLASLAVLGLATGPTHAQTARLILQSQSGDFIGQGQDYDLTYTPANSTFFSAQVLQEISDQPTDVLFTLGTPTGSNLTNTYTTLEFATTQMGIPLQVGSYVNAQRAAFATTGRPGMDVTFQNRGANTLTGSFNITDFSFVDVGGTPTITEFDATFEQQSEGLAPTLSGTFTYRNSPSAVPEPSQTASLGLGALGVLGLLVRARRRRAA